MLKLKSCFGGLSRAMALLLSLGPGAALAAEDVGTKYGVGFQSSFPAWGLSGMVDLNDQISVQGILGFIGDLKTYAGRGIYRFRREDKWNAYGYGMVGAWSYTGYQITSVFPYTTKETTETVMGFGAGVGIEYDWRAWLNNSDMPPIMWNVEIGIANVNFDEVDYDFSSFVFGVGAHYRF